MQAYHSRDHCVQVRWRSSHLPARRSDFHESQKCPCHVTFDLDLVLEHTLDAGSSGDHRVQVWWRSSHFRHFRKAISAKCLQTGRQTDGQTDGRRTPHDCISSWNSWAPTRGAQLTAGYTVNTYSKPPLYYTLGAVAPLLSCLLTAAVRSTAHALGPGGPLPHATPIYL